MDVLGIYNAALTQAGVSRLLSSTVDSSQERKHCSLWYETARDFVFRKAYWPVLRRSVVLALVAENDFADDWTVADPPLPWKYAYAIPADMIAARTLHPAEPSGGAPGEGDAEFTFHVMNGDRVIACNVEKAVLTYSVLQSDPSKWDPNLVMAVIHQLASHITMPLTKNPEFARSNFQLAQTFISMALESEANADHERLTEPTSEIIESRGGNAATFGVNRGA